MITQEGHAKILDFGLAKLIETKPDSTPEAATALMPVQHSTPGVVMGTVGYMSPEQAQAKPLDQRSDIFSFGCVLYEAATGRKAFIGDSVVDTLLGARVYCGVGKTDKAFDWFEKAFEERSGEMVALKSEAFANLMGNTIIRDDRFQDLVSRVGMKKIVSPC